MKMLTNFDPVDGGRDAFVIRACNFLGWVSFSLRIKSIDLSHSATKPNGDDVLRFALQ